MSRRDREKKDSLDALAKVAYSITGGNPAPAPPPNKKAAPPPPPKPAPPPPKPMDAVRAKQLAERRAKMEEEKALKLRRSSELARGTNLEWRGMSISGVPSGIRRTAWDREPSLDQKVRDVLGDPLKKEGRAKNSAKGKRQGGK